MLNNWIKVAGLLTFALATTVWAGALPKILEIRVEVLGDPSVKETYVRNHIRLRAGDSYTAIRTNEDVKNLMKSGRFADVQVKMIQGDGGVILIYEVTGYPLLQSVAFNRKIYERDANGTVQSRTLTAGLRISDEKLQKEIQLNKGVQFNRAQLHADEVALREFYIKKGYYPVEVKGRFLSKSQSVTFTIREGEEIKIEDMRFERTDGGKPSFDIDELDDFVKARERWRWYNPVTWFTNDGRVKPLELAEDIERLELFYRNRGYLDAQVSYRHNANESVLDNPEYLRMRKAYLEAAARLRASELALATEEANEGEDENEDRIEMLEDRVDDDEDALDDAEDDLDDFLDDNYLVGLTFVIDEGKRYRVGKVKFTYRRIDPADVDGARLVDVQPSDGYARVIPPLVLLTKIYHRPGEIYRPEALEGTGKEDSDLDKLEDAYGERAHIRASVSVLKNADVNSSTIDLEFKIYEGKTYYVDLVEIEGNEKTKDFVIRRELAISPGEPFDLGRMNLSRKRLQGLRIFEDVRADPDGTSEIDENEETLRVSVRETNTGRFTLTGGFSTDFGAFAGVMLSQENFDIGRWRKPHFWQGAGQKIRLRVIAGGKYSSYGLDFTEPWFLGRKLKFSSSLYARELGYFNDKFDVEETGVRLGLEHTLFGSDFWRIKYYYTVEDSGIVSPASDTSTELKNEAGTDIISQLGVGVALDTRGGGNLPTHGQRTSLALEMAPDVIGSEREFYGLRAKSAWYFKGLREGHVIELIGQAAVTDPLKTGQTVPYLFRQALGGSRTLRGFDYREVGPRGDQGDYLGGDSMLAGTFEYSVPTPWDVLRLATFYDWGVVNSDSWDFGTDGYNDNWGVGMRIDIPFFGPLRLDYGIPINDDGYNGGNKFNMNFGYTTTF